MTTANTENGPTRYWAHSQSNPDEPDSHTGWQPLAEHLKAVAELSRRLAAAAKPVDQGFQMLAWIAGLLHDYGKYTDAFQRMLCGGPRCQHSIHGAMLAFYGNGSGVKHAPLRHVASAIAGHHAGLHDVAILEERLREPKFLKEMRETSSRASGDCSAIAESLRVASFGAPPASRDEVSGFDLFTRMLFSCLVDADRLNSAGLCSQQLPLAAEGRLKAVITRIRGLSDQCASGLLRDMRAKVVEDCLAAASREERLFSLSVPTGGGKTLASMAFALKRAAFYPDQFRRIIVVIPYLSIIEQNAQVYADIFGPDAVLEHHSGSPVKLTVRDAGASNTAFALEELSKFVPAAEIGEDDQYQVTGHRAETENWDAPIVVTTSVRFFESLFSNRPRDLRRVHNIARSIVILDEVQTLPRRLLAPLLAMMRELAENWGVNFVFASATQPAFEASGGMDRRRWAPGTLNEIIREPAALRTALLRTQIRWEIDAPTDWPTIAERALTSPQCLTIVNLRRHAKELYTCLKERLSTECVFHLSTRMSAAHRLRHLELIRNRLNEGSRCYVCSTQLVEAGVDVDFPLVLRAFAPLDSIIQAAGRADREGKRTADLGRPGGEVVVFLPADPLMPSPEYAEAASVTMSQVLNEREAGREIQADSADVIQRYFERYYSDGDLNENLAEARQGIAVKFATVASEFEMISSRNLDVFVPDDDEAKQTLALLRNRRYLDPESRQRLRRHTVGLSPSEFPRARNVLEELTPGSDVWIAAEGAYSEELGLMDAIPPMRTIL